MKYAIFLLLLLLVACGGAEETLKVGAILPLSGPASVWGETIQQGMMLAQEDLEAQGISVDVIYQDSEGKGATGLSAYSYLTTVEDVDVVFSALSSVSIPLVERADADKMPLVLTMVAASDVASQSPYVVRFFTDAQQYAHPHFVHITKEKYPVLALLISQDEGSIAVAQTIKEEAEGKGIEVLEEKFERGSSDFRPQLTKFKTSEATGIIFVGTTPPETIGVMQQMNELDVNLTFFEALSNLGVPFIREAAGGAEGAYTEAYPFALGETGKLFTARYEETYGTAPLFSSAFGYDMLKMYGEAGSLDVVLSSGTYNSLNGPIRVTPEGEINPPLRSVQIVNGTLV